MLREMLQNLTRMMTQQKKYILNILLWRNSKREKSSSHIFTHAFEYFLFASAISYFFLLHYLYNACIPTSSHTHYISEYLMVMIEKCNNELMINIEIYFLSHIVLCWWQVQCSCLVSAIEEKKWSTTLSWNTYNCDRIPKKKSR